jgi:hypothetical protein
MLRKYSTIGLVVLSLALLLCLAQPAFAEEAKGKIVAVDGDTNELVVVTNQGERMVFTAAEHCNVTINDRPAHVINLREGDDVVVNYRRSGFEVPVAFSIQCRR